MTRRVVIVANANTGRYAFDNHPAMDWMLWSNQPPQRLGRHWVCCVDMRPGESDSAVFQRAFRAFVQAGLVDVFAPQRDWRVA